MSQNNDSQQINKSFWESIKEALKYTFQSAQGKYSLDTYLEVLSEFTDEEINKAIDEGLVYAGGEVSFLTKKEEKSILASIEMKFFNVSESKSITKKAERHLEKNMFVSETVAFFEEKGLISYEIKKPRRA